MKKKSFIMLATAALFAVMGSVSCGSSGGNGDGNDPQEPIDPDVTLLVTPSTPISLPFMGAKEVELTVTTNAASWDVAAPPSWVKTRKESNKLYVSAEDNPGAARSHKLKVTAPGTSGQEITVNQAAYEAPHASLQGSAYYLIALDATSYSLIQDKVVGDFRTNDVDNHLYLWSGDGQTYTGYASSGPNFYGRMEGWAAFIGGNGWTGGAYNTNNYDMSDVDDDWYFHMAVRSNRNAHNIYLVSGTGGSNYNMYIGPAGSTYGDEQYPVNHPVVWDGEWQEIEIPMSTMLDAGWLVPKGGSNNVMAFLSGTDPGKTLEMDAVFIYKKN